MMNELNNRYLNLVSGDIKAGFLRLCIIHYVTDITILIMKSALYEPHEADEFKVGNDGRAYNFSLKKWFHGGPSFEEYYEKA